VRVGSGHSAASGRYPHPLAGEGGVTRGTIRDWWHGFSIAAVPWRPAVTWSDRGHPGAAAQVAGWDAVAAMAVSKNPPRLCAKSGFGGWAGRAGGDEE